MMRSQRTIACVVFAAVIAIGVFGRGITRAQNAAPSTGVAVPDSTSPARTTGVNPDEIRKSVEQELLGLALPTQSIERKIRQAAEKLRDAEGDEAKASARQELAKTLGQYFDEDMARREKELAKLEERLQKLSAQLERRRAKRQDIIELQIQVAVNEADGLGFLSRPAYGSLQGPNMIIGAPFHGGPTIRLSNGDESLVLPAPHPQPHEPHPQSHHDSENPGESF